MRSEKKVLLISSQSLAGVCDFRDFSSAFSVENFSFAAGRVSGVVEEEDWAAAASALALFFCSALS